METLQIVSLIKFLCCNVSIYACFPTKSINFAPRNKQKQLNGEIDYTVYQNAWRR